MSGHSAEKDALRERVSWLLAKYAGRSTWVGFEKPRREAWAEIESDLRNLLRLTPSGAPMPDIEKGATRPLFVATTPGFHVIETWAVAVLGDGSEIRMRNAGDHVEVRTWDKSESCNPPELVVTKFGAHVVGLTSVPPPDGASA